MRKRDMARDNKTTLYTIYRNTCNLIFMKNIATQIHSEYNFRSVDCQLDELLIISNIHNGANFLSITCAIVSIHSQAYTQTFTSLLSACSSTTSRFPIRHHLIM